jgi:hypothetical protein
LETDTSLRGVSEGAAWLSSARAVRCRLKCHNEYFRESLSDSIDDAIDELGNDYSEEEIRLVRIKFISEMGN